MMALLSSLLMPGPLSVGALTELAETIESIGGGGGDAMSDAVVKLETVSMDLAHLSEPAAARLDVTMLARVIVGAIRVGLETSQPQLTLLGARIAVHACAAAPALAAALGDVRGVGRALFSPVTCLEFIEIAEEALSAMYRLATVSTVVAREIGEAGGIPVLANLVDFFSVVSQRQAMATLAAVAAVATHRTELGDAINLFQQRAVSTDDEAIRRDAERALTSLLRNGNPTVVNEAAATLAPALVDRRAVASLVVLARAAPDDAGRLAVLAAGGGLLVLDKVGDRSSLELAAALLPPLSAHAELYGAVHAGRDGSRVERETERGGEAKAPPAPATVHFADELLPHLCPLVEAASFGYGLAAGVAVQCAQVASEASLVSPALLRLLLSLLASGAPRATAAALHLTAVAVARAPDAVHLAFDQAGVGSAVRALAPSRSTTKRKEKEREKEKEKALSRFPGPDSPTTGQWLTSFASKVAWRAKRTSRSSAAVPTPASPDTVLGELEAALSHPARYRADRVAPFIHSLATFLADPTLDDATRLHRLSALSTSLSLFSVSEY
jgi:hypothetical protein